MFLRKLFRRFPRPKPASVPAEELEDKEELFDAAAVLLELAEKEDVDEVLRLLDGQLEKFQEQGQEEGVERLVARIEKQVGSKGASPAGRLALLGNVWQRLGKGTGHALRALSYYEEALAEYRQAGARAGEAVVLNNMALVYAEMAAAEPEYHRRVIPLLEEALQLCQGEEWLRERGAICMSLGEAYAGLQEPGPDHFELAKEYYERAWAVGERLGDRQEQARAQGRLGDVQASLAAFSGEEALERAVCHYRNALAFFVEEEDQQSCGLHQVKLARAYVGLSEEEHLRKARRAYEMAKGSFAQCNNRRALAEVCVELARLHGQLAANGAARELVACVEYYFEALDLYGEVGAELERAQVLRELARIYLQEGPSSLAEDARQAVRCLEEAAAVLARQSLGEEYEHVRGELEEARRCLAGATLPERPGACAW
jgi:tetratricopeptide (TPR) repeat protein